MNLGVVDRSVVTTEACSQSFFRLMKLLFVSDRGTKIDRVPTTAVDMIDHNFEQNNIY